MPTLKDPTHLPILELLRDLGIKNPGKTWPKLLKEHGQHLPEHTLKQFPMRDGRKGRLRPALAMVHHSQFMQVLEQAGLLPDPLSALPPKEKEMLDVLQKAFRDQDPELFFEVDGLRVDLILKKARLVVHCQSCYRHTREKLLDPEAFQTGLNRHGFDLLLLDIYQEGHHLGDLIFEVRKHLT